MKSKSLFKDITYLSSAEDVSKIKKMVFDNGDIPCIDYVKPLQSWVFHTLFLADGTKSEKPNLMHYFKGSHTDSLGLEKAIENRMAEILLLSGLEVRQQVRCAVGIADIVTDIGVYEVKTYLDARTFFSALGQVILYREAINPDGKAWIVGLDSGAEIVDMIEHARRLRVDVILLDRGDIDA